MLPLKILFPPRTRTGLLLLMLGVSGFFLVCSDGKRDIRDYYFPLESLREGRVYVYAATEGDSTDRRYCAYRTEPRDSGRFLLSIQYDRYFDTVQVLHEKILSSGSLARRTILYEQDTALSRPQPVEADIESASLFPFRVTDSLGIFLFSLRYHPQSDPSASVYLIRNRRFLGDGPEFEFAGKKYPTVRFELSEVAGHDKNGASEIAGTGEEQYARGLGLVYFQKSFSEGKIRYAFRLQEILEPAELERRSENR